MLRSEHYFVDFLRDAEEPVIESLQDVTDDMDFEMPHIYEVVPSWDVLQGRLTFFMNQYNEQVFIICTEC